MFYLRGVVWSWLLMVTPLYTALLLAFLTSVDQNNGIWKLLLAQRVSRAPLYAAKLGVGFPLVAWSQVVLLAACLGVGFLLPALRPELGDYKPGVDVPHLVTMLALAYVAGFLIDRHSGVAGYEVSEFCLASWRPRTFSGCTKSRSKNAGRGSFPLMRHGSGVSSRETRFSASTLSSTCCFCLSSAPHSLRPWHSRTLGGGTWRETAAVRGYQTPGEPTVTMPDLEKRIQPLGSGPAIQA